MKAHGRVWLGVIWVEMLSFVLKLLVCPCMDFKRWDKGVPFFLVGLKIKLISLPLKNKIYFTLFENKIYQIIH